MQGYDRTIRLINLANCDLLNNSVLAEGCEVQVYPCVVFLYEGELLDSYQSYT